MTEARKPQAATSSPPTWKVAIGDGCFMVGHRNGESLLQCNTYLRTFEGKRPFHWCVDPGSQIDFPHVRRNLEDHVGELRRIDFFSVNHQDPDVVGNMPALCNANEKIAGLVTEDTWRLTRHLGAQPHRLYYADRASRNRVHLPNGDEIHVVATPFCHFRGAMAFYDPGSRILFSGDLFGGLNRPGAVHLLAEESDWSGIAQFHQIYMPTNSALRFAIEQVRRLKPAVQAIAPQHGFVLTGDVMHMVMDRLEKLPVGLDLQTLEFDEKHLKDYQEIFRDLIADAERELGKDVVYEKLRAVPATHELRRSMLLKGRVAELARNGFRALPMLVDALSRDQFPAFRNRLRSIALERCIFRDVPIPNLGAGSEEGGETE